MTKQISWLIAGIFLLISCAENQVNNKKDAGNINSTVVNDTKLVKDKELNKLTERETSEGWQLLFDGETTKGWHNYNKNGLDGWQVKEGILFTTGKGGDIITNNQYTHFELQVEWKIKPEGNSGIFYKVVESEEYDYMYQTGPEFQIIDDEDYPQELLDKQKTGALSDVIAPRAFASNPPGEWNSTSILVKEKYVEHWLNGKKVVEYKVGTSKWEQLVSESKFSLSDYAHIPTGHIGLQDHGSYVGFRNIKIREL